MSDEQDRERERRAAKRCGADPDVWRLVHELHGSGKRIDVTTTHGPVQGDVTYIDDECFHVHTWPVAWPEVLQARPYAPGEAM